MPIDLTVLESAAALAPPSSLVVRYGYMRMMGEFPYDGDTRPGCGAKVVIRTKRGTELAEVVTTTCSNGGCAKSITRDKLIEYIENSGGRDYPFSTEGRIVRVATPEDLRSQAEAEKDKPNYVATCKTLIREMNLPMKLVEVELLLGGEMATFFFMSESRVDFRALVKHLAGRFRTRIQMHQVGARDEARLVADYETCGQHCCCKQFLKVLKPISMGAAKMQKATLDPNKISGRCGRLKCCLRYEEETYEDLKRKLPRIGSRVRTGEGVGVVEETMILTQLVRIRLGDNRMVAIANEEILERDVKEMPKEPRDVREPRREAPRPAPPQRGRPQPEPRPEAGPAPVSLPKSPPATPAEREIVRQRIDTVADAAEGPSDAPPEAVIGTDPASADAAAVEERAAEAEQGQQPPQQQPPGMGAMGRGRRRGRGRGRG